MSERDELLARILAIEERLANLVLPETHDAVTLTAAADVILALTGQQVGVDNQNVGTFLGGPAVGIPGAPTFRALVAGDLAVHDVAGSKHSITGAQYQLVGATALNTLGLLTPSSGPGAAVAILCTDASGKVHLVGLRLGTYAVHEVISKAGIADNVATSIFTVTTTNEVGNADGGTYICHVRAQVSHASAPATGNTAVKFYEGRFASSIMNTGATAALSAVTAIADDCLAATAPASRSIGVVTGTVAATSNYVRTFSLQIDLTGAAIATAEVAAEVTVIYYGFTTPPAVAAA